MVFKNIEYCIKQYDRTPDLTVTILRSAHTVYLFALFGSENKQRLFPYTELTDGFLQQRFKPLFPSGYYLYHQFNIHQFHVMPTEYIYVS